MFKQARVKLTLFYLLIIMLVSSLFSVAIYRVLASELDRVERVQRSRFEHRPPDRFEMSRPMNLDPELVAETKNRLKMFLVAIDLVILGASTAAGYFLAGRTLKPIAEMVDEQRRFVADASHELRTPLTAIKTETEVAIRDKKLDEPTKKLLVSNLEEIEKLKSLTDYFLALSKYQDFNVKLTFEIFNVSSAIEDACKRLQYLARERKVEVNKNLKDVMVLANKTGITEIITILLDNAIKYSHKGGKVNIDVETKRNTVLIRVEDFGLGMKASEIPYIFNRFYRADSSRTKTPTNGYGLGLSIAKSLVDLHNGKIMVGSIVGKGSTFTVLLPLKQNWRFM